MNNAWYDRRTGEQVITNSPATWPWSMNTLSPDVETLYQAVKRTWPDATTLAANEPCDTGADVGTFTLMRAGTMPDKPPKAEDLPFATERFVRPEKKYATSSRVDHVGLELTLGVWGEGYQGTSYPTPKFSWVNFSLTDAGLPPGRALVEVARASILDTDAGSARCSMRSRPGRVRPAPRSSWWPTTGWRSRTPRSPAIGAMPSATPACRSATRPTCGSTPGWSDRPAQTPSVTPRRRARLTARMPRDRPMMASTQAITPMIRPEELAPNNAPVLWL